MITERLGDLIRHAAQHSLGVRIALGVTMLFCCPYLVLGAEEGSRCEVIDAPALPERVSSAAWSPAGDRVLLADPSLRRVMVYSDQGHFLGVMPNPSASLGGGFSPRRLKRDGAELVVEVRPRELLFVDSRYRLIERRAKLEPKRAVSALDAKSAGLLVAAPSGEADVSIVSMPQYELAAGDVIACSDLQSKTGDGKTTGWTGIVRFPIADPDEFDAYRVSHYTNSEWTYCRLGLPYIATLGDQGFVLLFGDEPGIYRSAPGGATLARLDEYPRDHLRAPTLPEFSNTEEFAAVMGQVESSTMPVGLYAWGDGEEGALFVLRRVASRERDGFLLDKVDPATGKLLGTAEVRTDAKHLLLVPGEQWLMVEQGRFLSFNQPQVEQLRLVSGEVFAKDFGGTICN